MPGQIKKLSENVINKIAAGEVIKDPSAIVKEMVENSIDAKSTSISVHIRKGGLDLIEIADNGGGIDYDDFPLLCERFATSKISSSDDLRSVSSFGFRGEALASVSYVSNLSVISKTKASDIAYTAKFYEGRLIGETDEEENPTPRPIQGHDGTIMTVEDLFMNIPSRKAGLSASEEYSKVLKLLMKLAMHYHMISFTLKKDGKVELSTTNIVRRDRRDDEIRQDMISRFYGNNVGQNLLRFEVNLDDYKCHMKITLTKPDKRIKGKNLVLFINDRLVECDSIKKALSLAYSDSVFGIHDLNGEYFAYIDMKMKPEYIDVNVNPTKKEVHFLNEKIIADKLKADTEALLKDNMNVKTFNTPILKQLSFDGNTVPAQGAASEATIKKVSAINMVRTDPKAQRLDKFFKQSEEKIGGVTITQITTFKAREEDKMEIEEDDREEEEEDEEEAAVKEKIVDERMMVINRIIEDYAKKSNKESSKFLQNLVLVGALSTNYAFCQFEQQLLMINMIPLCEEVFYLVCLKQFGNFPIKAMKKPLKVKALLELALQEGETLDPEQSEQGSTDELTEKCMRKLKNIENTLREHLSITIVDGDLVAMPYILEDVYVRDEDIGELLVRLCTEIVYNDTKEMIQDMCRNLSFYMAWSLENADIENFDKSIKVQSDRLFEGHVFPLIKTEFPFCKVKREDLCIKLLQLEDIYKIFERC